MLPNFAGSVLAPCRMYHPATPGAGMPKPRLPGGPRAYLAGASSARSVTRRFAGPPCSATLPAMATLNVGDTAPDFQVADTDGQMHKLSEMVTRGPVILAFFPKAFTPG